MSQGNERFEQHRARLARMVQMRLDPRLRRRVDVDDVLQEVWVEASRRLPEHERAPSMPFFLWLRLLTAQKLVELYRRHLGAEGRDVRRELHSGDGLLPRSDSTFLADRISGHLTSPSSAAAREEMRERLREALDRMPPADREVLVLRHYEQLTSAEAARELGLEPSAASKRYVRALGRLRTALAGLDDSTG